MEDGNLPKLGYTSFGQTASKLSGNLADHLGTHSRKWGLLTAVDPCLDLKRQAPGFKVAD